MQSVNKYTGTSRMCKNIVHAVQTNTIAFMLRDVATRGITTPTPPNQACAW